MLQKLAENYEDVDEMRKDFYCQIFNNNFTDQLVVLSGSERAAEIKEIVNKFYSKLQLFILTFKENEIELAAQLLKITKK